MLESPELLLKNDILRQRYRKDTFVSGNKKLPCGRHRSIKVGPIFIQRHRKYVIYRTPENLQHEVCVVIANSRKKLHHWDEQFVSKRLFDGRLNNRPETMTLMQVEKNPSESRDNQKKLGKFEKSKLNGGLQKRAVHPNVPSGSPQHFWQVVEKYGRAEIWTSYYWLGKPCPNHSAKTVHYDFFQVICWQNTQKTKICAYLPNMVKTRCLGLEFLMEINFLSCFCCWFSFHLENVSFCTKMLTVCLALVDAALVAKNRIPKIKEDD